MNKELEGYYILSESGSHKYFDAEYQKKIEIENTLGASDALFSAVCASAFNHDDIKGDKTRMKIIEWVSAILQIKGSHLARVSTNIKDERQDLLKVVFTIFFFLVSIASTIIGSFKSDLIPLYFGIIIFAIALCGGAAGSLSRDMVSRVTSQKKKKLSLIQSIALGMIAGVLASLIGILPGIASGGGIAELPKQGLLPLMIFIVSICTGIALDLFFDNLTKKSPGEIIDFNR